DLDDAPEARRINRVTLAGRAEHIEIVESEGQRAAHLGAEKILQQVFVFIPRNLTTDQNGLMVTHALPSPYTHLRRRLANSVVPVRRQVPHGLHNSARPANIEIGAARLGAEAEHDTPIMGGQKTATAGDPAGERGLAG